MGRGGGVPDFFNGVGAVGRKNVFGGGRGTDFGYFSIKNAFFDDGGEVPRKVDNPRVPGGESPNI